MTDNTAALNEAFESVGTLMASDDTKLTSDILNVAKKVIGGLDAVQKVHPYIEATVLSFKGFIALEVKRRVEDQRVSGLILAAIDTMSELLSLNSLSDPDQALPSGQTIRGRLQGTLEKVPSTIEACGNVVDKYHNSKTISKFFKATSWEEKFEGFLDSFQSLKRDIKSAVINRSALPTEDAIPGIDQVDVRLDLRKLIRTRPKIDEDIAKEVEKRGGADIVLNNSVKIREVTEAITKKGGIESAKSKGDEDKTVEASLLHELRIPLETQLGENKQLYLMSLELAKYEIKNAIRYTESRVSAAIDEGAYVRVKDPHLRYIWRVMKWPLSVQTSFFIPALRDYFREHVGSATRDHAPLNDALSSRSLAAQTPNDEHEPPRMPHDDEWCLEYLSIFYVPALKEAFDDDVSGLVNIREVNQFARSKSMPEGWSILKRLAYAAVGWRLELYRYSRAIQALYNTMIYDANGVLPENRSFVCSYVDSYVHTWVKQLARGVEEVVGSIEMEKLVTERSNRHETHLDQLLARVDYEIPSVDMVSLYFDDNHVEHFLMPVIWVLLLRHGRLINLAKKFQLDRRELELCSTTLSNVLGLAVGRMSTLTESFRQQGLDAKTQFSTFYGGLYRIFNDESLMPDEYEYWSEHRNTIDEWGIDLGTLTDESDTHFGSPDPIKIAYGAEWQDELETTDAIDPSELSLIQRFQRAANQVLRKVQQTRRWDHFEARRAAIKEYETIAVAAALDSLVGPGDGRQYLSEDDQKKLDRLVVVLSPRDLAYCRAKGEIEMRKSFAVYVGYYCDGCHRSPMTNNRYDCLDCPQTDYQLCSDCVNLPTNKHEFPSDTHTLEHNMCLYRVEIPRIRAGRLRSARSSLVDAVPRHDIDFGDEPASEEVDATNETREAGEAAVTGASAEKKPVPSIVENCTECNIELPGAFYACRTCSDMDGSVLVLCDGCAFRPELANAPCGDHSFNTHFLVLIRNRNAPYLHREPESESELEEEETKGEEPTISALAKDVKGLQAQMATMLELIQALHTSLSARSAPE